MLITPPRTDLCLSYVNTLSWRGTPSPVESLHDFAELLTWLRTPGGISAPMHAHKAWARQRPETAARVVAQAIALRESLYRLLAAAAAGKGMPGRDFVHLQSALAAAPARRRLVRSGTTIGWRVGDLRPTAPQLLAPVLWSAADLLAGDLRARVHQCANDRCLWLFLDASKGAARRWCDMASCGNRAKARRHYLKLTRGSVRGRKTSARCL